MVDRRKHIERDGHSFLLEDVSGDWCCIKVTYGNRVGYLGIRQSGTLKAPYAWFVDEENNARVTPDGLTAGKPIMDFDKGLGKLCQKLREPAVAVVYDKEQACSKLRDYINGLNEP